MNPRLRVEVGRQVNFEFEVPPTNADDPVWLGRGAFCKIRIPDNLLSRRHSQFMFENGRFFVADMGSQNGTRVNESFITERVELKDGDHVTVGNHELVVVFPVGSAGIAASLPDLGTQAEEQEALKALQALVGTEMAGCKLDKIIHNGDRAVVFRGTDAGTGGDLAVKVLKQLERNTVEDKNRFVRGAKHGAALRHPNFVRVLKGGRIDDWFYIAMEYVRSRSLVRILEINEGPLEVALALKILRQVLEALQYAFEQDIVFRAVRPDNVLVSEDAQIKLTDFDLVKPLAGRQDAQVTRVMDGSITVDPSFAAPELIAYPAVADQKADVFGAGAVLYFMLTDRAPFGDRMPANKLTSAFDRTVKDPRELNPEVSEALWNVMKQAMSDYERYNSPGEMLEAIDEAAGSA